MHPKFPKLLEDIRAAADYIVRATADQTLESYLDNDTLRFAVERNFEIIGEALNRLVAVDSDTAIQIEDFKQIISFRNTLIYGYDLMSGHI